MEQQRSSGRKKKQTLDSLQVSSSDRKPAMSGRAAALKRLSERANSLATTNPSLPSPPSSSSLAPPPSSSSTSPRKIAFSFEELGQAIIQQLRSYGVRVDPGLSDEELELVQAAFHITFPPDLRGLLQQGLPIGPGFPDWRSHLGSHKLKLWIASPKTGLCSAAELGLFWWRGWGARPPEPDGAARTARAALRRVPVLVPVFGRCYLPSLPVRAGNPVIFVERSEAFYCANGLPDFFAKECFKRFVNGGGDAGGGSSGGTGNGLGYYPEAMVVQQHEPVSRAVGVESARKMIARCVSNIGEDLEGLEAALAERRSSVSARSVLAGPRASSTSRSSDGSSDEGPATSSAPYRSLLPRMCHSSSSGSSSSSSGGSSMGGTIRRIEFWSDLIEKRQSMSCVLAEPSAAGGADRFEHDDYCFIQGDGPELDWYDHHHESSSSWRSVKESVSEIAVKLRRAGWNERDVAEIVDSCDKADDDCSLSDHRSQQQQQQPADRQSVIEGLAAHLDLLSSCLRDAGWSIHDISETLYSDLTGFSEHPGRGGARISPEVASRIGALAAFVAQG